MCKNDQNFKDGVVLTDDKQIAVLWCFLTSNDCTKEQCPAWDKEKRECNIKIEEKALSEVETTLNQYMIRTKAREALKEE